MARGYIIEGVSFVFRPRVLSQLCVEFNTQHYPSLSLRPQPTCTFKITCCNPGLTNIFPTTDYNSTTFAAVNPSNPYAPKVIPPIILDFNNLDEPSSTLHALFVALCIIHELCWGRWMQFMHQNAFLPFFPAPQNLIPVQPRENQHNCMQLNRERAQSENRTKRISWWWF